MNTLTPDPANNAPPARLRVNVAEIPREGKRQPYVIEHDRSQHRPWGLFRIYIDRREIGRLASFPSAADCSRMEHEPPPVSPRDVVIGRQPASYYGVTRDAETRRRAARRAGESAYRRRGPALPAAESAKLIDSRGGAEVIGPLLKLHPESVRGWARRGMPRTRVESITALPEREKLRARRGDARD